VIPSAPALAAALLGSARAEAPPPIVGGDPTGAFPAVGVLVAVLDGAGAAFCSGTLAHREHVVTAGHCQVAIEQAEDAGYDVVFAVGRTVWLDDGIDAWTRVAGHERHPDYADDGALLHDIAVLELEDPIDEIEPLPLSALSPEASTWTFDALQYVGWGVTSDGGLDLGVKREAQIPYLGADDMYLYAYDPAGVNLCSGDSGGAALIPTDDGGWALAGVNAFVFSPGSSTPACEGGASGATRVDAHLDWLRAAAPALQSADRDEVGGGGAGGGGGSGSLGSGDTGGCSAASPWTGHGLALSVISLFGALRMRRRR
jgi:secreted trypsin-like serine protease